MLALAFHIITKANWCRYVGFTGAPVEWPFNSTLTEKTREKHQPSKQIRFYKRSITWMTQSGYHLYRAPWGLIMKHMSKRSYLFNLEIFPTHLPSWTICWKQPTLHITLFYYHSPCWLLGDHIHYPMQACKHAKLIHHPPSNHNIIHSHVFHALALHSVSTDPSCYYPESPHLNTAVEHDQQWNRLTQSIMYCLRLIFNTDILHT